jgi:hypothetical protein
LPRPTGRTRSPSAAPRAGRAPGTPRAHIRGMRGPKPTASRAEGQGIVTAGASRLCTCIDLRPVLTDPGRREHVHRLGQLCRARTGCTGCASAGFVREAQRPMLKRVGVAEKAARLVGATAVLAG